MTNTISKLNIPNKWNKKIYGNKYYPEGLNESIKNENNIHSYHRWCINKNYYEVLNNSKILVYPSIDKYNAPGWDSKRPWEALAMGCLLLSYKQDDFDNHEYPVDEVSIIFKNSIDLTNKINYFYNNIEELDKLRKKNYKNAMKYFTSVPISRYFLWKISETNIFNC